MITCHVRYEIDPEQLSEFERFARRWMELVDLHGGAIDVRSAIGQGTTFTISLPPAPSAAFGGRSPGSAPPLSQRRVLIVDDEPPLAARLEGLA